MVNSNSESMLRSILSTFTPSCWGTPPHVACNAVVSLSENRVSHELAVCRPEINPTKSRPSLTLGWWLGTTKLARKSACGRLLPTTRPASGDGMSRQLDVKRPTRAIEELHQVAATRAERRLLVQVI